MKRLLILLILFLTIISVDADTYVVSVGIGNYGNPKVQKLMKTETDAKAIADFYKKGTKNVIVITGKYATKSQILNSIRSQFMRAKKDDKIVFFFSGHGYPGGFCPYDMTKLEEGIKYSEVIDIMQRSKAKNKFIFADACYSGAIRKKESVSYPSTGNILLFLSSRGNEYSEENPYIANGCFTKYLLRGLGGGADTNRDRRITAQELFNYVSEGVRSQTKDRQHPVMWGKFDDNLTIVEYSKRLFY